MSLKTCKIFIPALFSNTSVLGLDVFVWTYRDLRLICVPEVKEDDLWKKVILS